MIIEIFVGTTSMLQLIPPQVLTDRFLQAHQTQITSLLPTRKKFNGISASLGASYKLASQLYIKANIGRAYRAPNITEMASNGLDPGAHIIYLGNKKLRP